MEEVRSLSPIRDKGGDGRPRSVPKGDMAPPPELQSPPVINRPSDAGIALGKLAAAALFQEAGLNLKQIEVLKRLESTVDAGSQADVLMGVLGGAETPSQLAADDIADAIAVFWYEIADISKQFVSLWAAVNDSFKNESVSDVLAALCVRFEVRRFRVEPSTASLFSKLASEISARGIKQENSARRVVDL